jgi:hypothetical protein
MPPSTDAFFDLVFFAESSCNGAGLLEARAPAITSFNSVPGFWYFTPGPDVVAPPTAMSVAFELVLEIPAPITGSVDFDNVYFGPQGLGPPAVPVSVPTLSGSVLPLFAAALAAVAIWRLTVR